MNLYYRAYIGPRYVTDLCVGCLEKFTRDHVVIITPKPIQNEQSSHWVSDPDLYHRSCFEDDFKTDIEIVGSLQINRTTS